MQSDEFAAVREQVRHFVRTVVVPAEARIEADDEVPADIVAQAKAMGLYGFTIAQEYGGLGLSVADEVELVIELGYTTPSLRSHFGTNNGIAGHVLMEAGTPAQRQAFLPRLASGEWIASFALTEEHAGSDPSALTTAAVRDGDGWVITGAKRFITNAPTADVFMVFARTDPSGTGGRGISVFMVPAATPGLTVGPPDHKMGQRGALTADVWLDGARVSADALVGGPDAEGSGLRTAMKCLAHGRIHIAALCVGMAQRLVDESATYASSRVQGGKVIAEHQLVQAMLADSQTDLMAGMALVRAAACSYDDRTDRRLAPSCAKYFCSEMVDRVADRAVQIHGGAGYMQGVPAERFYRDARLFRIYEGTSQIQQLIIARELLRGVAVAS